MWWGRLCYSKCGKTRNRYGEIASLVGRVRSWGSDLGKYGYGESYCGDGDLKIGLRYSDCEQAIEKMTC